MCKPGLSSWLNVNSFSEKALNLTVQQLIIDSQNADLLE